ncbi:hypothetical protein K2173_024748 [Erythroxylum novogranatense]|uniref:uracil phosphoribosyltransferase n=1 Tax=Erythroxylum novogranatense TaxID=1862640 RepID=A0AAV8SV59_9ROSI|nr:hypothetical protein K2173_024748 [Erythroxylum novogranatense]
MEIEQSEGRIKLSQKKYVSEVLKKFKLDQCKPTSTPVCPKEKFMKKEDGDESIVCAWLIEKLQYYILHMLTIILNIDLFYHSLSGEKLEKVHEYNFDHPDVIIVEGILVLHDARVRDLMNMRVFVDTDSDLRLARRIQRDTVERGRNIQNVLDQLRKIHTAFKKFADIIIPRAADNDVAIDLIVQHICTKLGQHDLCKIYPNDFVISSTFQIRGMHTLIRDVNTTKHDFVVEHGLGHLSFTERQITAPTGSVYPDVVFCKRLYGVSIIRSGESMENALRACCKGIKIGKILIHGEGNNGRQLIYEKLPTAISRRQVLLLDPVLASGNSAVKPISLLLSKGVPECSIIFLNLIAPQGIHVVCKKFPKLKIVTSEIDEMLDKDT